MNGIERISDSKKRSKIWLTVLLVISLVIISSMIFSWLTTSYGSWDGPLKGSWELTEISSTEGKIEFNEFQGNIGILDIRIFVYENGTDTGVIYLDWEQEPRRMVWDKLYTSNPASKGASVIFLDHDEIGEISSGDLIILYGLSPGTTYSFEVFHIPSDSIIKTNDISFTTDSD